MNHTMLIHRSLLLQKGIVVISLFSFSGIAAARTSAQSAHQKNEPLKIVITGGPGVGKTTIVNALKQKGFIAVPEGARQVIKKEQRKKKILNAVKASDLKGSDRKALLNLLGSLASQRLIKKDILEMASSPKYTPALPWQNIQEFENQVIKQQIKNEKSAVKKSQKIKNIPGIVFDRSLVDPIAYIANDKKKPAAVLPLTSELLPQIKNAHYSKVFFLDQLPSYQNDTQRRENVAAATAIHNKLYEVYTNLGKELGFEVVRVPAFTGANVQEAVQKRVDFILNQIPRSPHTALMTDEQKLI